MFLKKLIKMNGEIKNVAIIYFKNCENQCCIENKKRMIPLMDEIEGTLDSVE